MIIFCFLAIGFSTSMSAFSLALNTYFNKKRSMATGICITITGLGPVLMPLVCIDSKILYHSKNFFL